MNFRLIPCALAALLVGALDLQAQTNMWNVSSGNWGAGGNWQSGVPTISSDVVFNNASTFSSTVDTNYSVNSVNVQNGGGAFTLGNSASFTLATASGSSFTDNSANTVFVDVGVVGLGNVVIQGGGIFIVASTNSTFSSGYVVANGILSDNSVNAFSPNSLLEVGPTGIVLVNNNETSAGLIDYSTGNGQVKIAVGKTLTLAGGFSTTYSGTIVDNGGAGALTVNTLATLTLTGANTYTGLTSIGTGAAINIGGGGPTGSIVSNVNGTGTGGLSFDRNNAYTYGGVLSGNLNVVQQGTGTTTLSGTNTYTGPTTVNFGVLQAGSAGAFGNLSAVTINGSGTLDLNNFNSTLGTLNSFSTSSAITLGTGTLTVGTAAVNSTFDGVISGGVGGGLTLNNVDGYSLSLAGNNTYTGATNVTNGTLVALNTAGSAVGTGPISIGSGAVLQVGSLTTTGAIGTANIADNGTLTFARTDSITVPNTISGFGGVTVDRGTVTLTGNNTYTGFTSVSQGTLDAGSATALGNHSTVYLSTNGALNLNGNNISVGNISSLGDTSTSVNLGPNTLTLANAISNQTFAGAITGTGALDVISTLDVTSTINTYSGGTTIAGGTLVADNMSGSATGTGAITISGGGTLIIGNDSTTGYIANLPITDNGLIDFQRTDSITFPNAITGAGSVEAQDGGTITLTGTNTYSGFTNVTGGLTGTTLVAGSNSAFGNGTSALSLAPGASTGSINLNNFSNAVGSIVGNVGTFIILGSGTLTSGAAGGTNIYGGVISGTGGLNVVAPGNVVLTGANTYSGPTSVASGGHLAIGFGGTTGSIANSSSVSGAGTLQFNRTNAITYAGTLFGALSVVQSGTGTTTLSGSNSYSGMTSVNNGTLADGAASSFSPNSSMLVNSAGGSLTVNFNETVGDLQNGGTGGPVSIASGRTLTSDGISNPGPFTGIISGAGGIVIDTGIGSQGLGGANTYTGVTTMHSGELFVSSSTVGAPGSVTSGPIGTNTLVFTGNTELSSIISNVTLANAINLSGFNLDNDDATSDLTITGPIAGSGGSITWCTNNLLALVNTNTFTGGVDMRLGQLALGSDMGAGVGGTIILDTGADLYTYAGPGINRSVANPINFTGGSASLGNNDDNYLTLTGNISGGGSVTYTGGSTGTLTLNPAANTFNGNFTIASGTVTAFNNFAFGGATSVSLTGGASLNVDTAVTVSAPLALSGAANVLAGSGTIASPVTANAALVISPATLPGGGPGELTFSSGLTIASGAAIHFDIYDATGTPGLGFSLINATGGLGLTASANTITFNLVSTNSTGGAANAINFNPAMPYSWTFASSSSAITGFNANQFNLVTAGFSNATGGGTFSFSEVGQNLDLNFTPVPEPSTWAMMGMGVFALAAVGLRQRRLARA